MLTVQKTREVRETKKLPLHCYYAVIWQNILEEALDFQGSKSQILASFLPYRLLVIFFFVCDFFRNNVKLCTLQL